MIEAQAVKDPDFFGFLEHADVSAAAAGLAYLLGSIKERYLLLCRHSADMVRKYGDPDVVRHFLKTDILEIGHLFDILIV